MSLLRILIGTLIAVGLFILAVAGPSVAQTPANPTTLEVDVAQTNVDGSNLADLKHTTFCVGLATTPATTPLSNCVNVAAPAADPAAGAQATAPLAAFNLSVDGAYVADAYHEDIAGNRSARHARVPFPWNVAPSAPNTLRVR